jgi:hypothetical protein
MLAIMKTFSKEDLEFIFNGYDDNLSIKDNMMNHKFYQLFDCR